ncbi:MAG: ABC transporter substrate-binding protein [Thermoleophilia bacterium]
MSHTALRGLVALMMLSVGLVLAGCGAGQEPRDFVTIVQIAPASMEDALRSGEIDGFLAWEPFPVRAVQAGGVEYLASSKDIWSDHPCCVLAADRGLTDRQTVDALLWVHLQATDFLVNPANREKAVEYGVEFTGTPEVVVREALDRLTYSADDPQAGLRRLAQSLGGQQMIPAATGEDFWKSFVATDEMAAVRERMAAEPPWVPTVGPGTVRVGFIASGDLHQLALHVGLREGLFEQVGLVEGQNLALRPYPNGVAIMQAFAAGELDAAYLGVAPALLKSINDRVPIAVLAGANQEGSSLVVRAGIERVEDLAGLRVAVPQVGTVQHILLLMLLKRYGLQPRLG